MNLVQFIVLAGCLAGIHCLPVDNTITNPDALLDAEVKGPISSVDQALSNKAGVKLEETTTSSGQLFNNNEPEEDKIFKINEADDLIDLAPSSKQASGGMPNVQSLIDQTNTISSNLETMIKDMVSVLLFVRFFLNSTRSGLNLVNPVWFYLTIIVNRLQLTDTWTPIQTTNKRHATATMLRLM